jgi:hypothetical protein
MSVMEVGRNRFRFEKDEVATVFSALVDISNSFRPYISNRESPAAPCKELGSFFPFCFVFAICQKTRRSDRNEKLPCLVSLPFQSETRDWHMEASIYSVCLAFNDKSQ